jgi:flagellar protein FliJ
MSSFRFPLQRILELRTRREQALAAELARSQADAEQARDARDELRAVREANLNERAADASGTPSVGELRNSGFVVDRLDERIHLAHLALDTAEARLAERIRAFNDAVLDRRVLDRLRDRQLTQWQVEQAQIDRLAMDAIALTRFTQRISNKDREE